MIYTSNFARIKKLPAGIEPVSIARGAPWWFKGNECEALMPTEEILALDIAAYTPRFRALLSDLDPAQAARELDGCALLCWEAPNVKCHRRLVAEWLETALGIVVCEFGFERCATLPYDKMPTKHEWRASKIARRS